MRDLTTRQNRVPHSWDALSMDCNVRIEVAEELFKQTIATSDEESKQGYQMFVMFLGGKTYDDICIVFNTTRHYARKSITQAYRCFRREHCSV